jgi:hypothetical protein
MAIKELSGWFTPTLQKTKWIELLNCSDPGVQVKSICYLSDRLYGKAPQAVEIAGKDGEALTFVVTRSRSKEK